MVKILTENPVHINWWVRNPESLQHIKQLGNNPRYLSSVALKMEQITLFGDKREALKGSDWVLIAVPSAFVDDVLQDLTPEDLAGKGIVSAVKGMIAGEHELVTTYLQERFGVDKSKNMFIAGPCHAEEIANERQSYLTLAGNDREYTEAFAGLLRGRYVRVTTNTDVDGAQYAAVFKNIIALAGGIAHGTGHGDNFMAVLVSNAMQEMQHMLDTFVPHQTRDMLASAYTGDLLVTAYSQFSRNRTFGTMIGRGYSVKSAQVALGMVAEGYYGVRSLYKVSRGHETELPIVKAVHRMLYENIAPAIEMRLLRDSLK